MFAEISELKKQELRYHENFSAIEFEKNYLRNELNQAHMVIKSLEDQLAVAANDSDLRYENEALRRQMEALEEEKIILFERS